MAKPKGYRANKSNDSFGSINNDKLYRGKYREEVYKEDDEEKEESETVEVQADPKEKATQQTDESFAAKPTQEEHDYKKRYDDLKRHYDEKLSEFKSEREELVTQLQSLKGKEYAMPRGVAAPKTAEELEDFKQRYPDVFEVVETVSGIQAETSLAKMRQELDDIKAREKDLEKQKAFEELLRLHPDFDTLKSDQDFLSWLEDQPESLSNGIYKNNTNAKLAARVIDLYKADKGISKSQKKTKSSDAAASVSRPQAREVATQKSEAKIWNASDIAKMKPWEYEKLEAEIDTARSEGRINFNS
jgi:hypothetical protein